VDYTPLDDEALIRLIVHAQADALGALYGRYGRLVFSVALNAVGDPDTAEEIVQDVFVRVWERARQYRADQGKVSTWLTSIARHRAIDQLRRQGARAGQHSVGWADLLPQAEPISNGPEQAAELAGQRERVRAAVARLPAEQKQVLALAYFQGQSHSEIALALDLPLGTVKTRIRLAMDKLRVMLTD